METMIKVLIGDMFQSNADFLVNTVNCEGVMGKGVALEFKKKFPEMFKEYLTMCKSGEITPGKLTVHGGMFDSKKVINFPTKKHWRSPTLVRDIESGLDFFLENYKKWGIEKVAFPPLGCGNGGLTWEVVGPLMYQKLKDIEDIDIEIYAPFGTAEEKLSKKYLEENENAYRPEKGSLMRSSLQPGEILVVETLYRLQNRAYAKPIGRIMFQKACYILTETGAPTDFKFVENSFGPYSSEAKKSITILANNNLTTEEKVGNMLKTTVSQNYEKFRKDYASFIADNEKYISKAVDLLSRIKNTSQGEEVATVIHATKAVAEKTDATPLDSEVIDYIYSWKKTWKGDQLKARSLPDTVLSLAMLGWINVNISPTTTS